MSRFPVDLNHLIMPTLFFYGSSSKCSTHLQRIHRIQSQVLYCITATVAVFKGHTSATLLTFC